MTDPLSFLRPVALALAALAAAATAPALHAQAPASAGASAPRSGDFIVAIVNQELVTASELEARLARIRADAARNKAQLPPPDELRRQVVEVLIDERVQLTHAREFGQRVDEAELDRAVANVAVQNQITLDQLRERLRREGIDYGRFRANVRDQMMTERLREREVMGRIRVSDADIDAYLAERQARAGAAAEYNIAQILVGVPEAAAPAELQQRRARAEAAFARVKAGESFEAVAREVSEDANRAQGGVIGMRPAERLPDVFVEVVRPLKVGEVAATPLRTGAGFHVLKLVDKREANAFTVQQTRVRHILLRVSAQLPQEAASRRLAGFRQQIESGQRTFEQLARENSEDGSAAQGGELGWASPGMFVPEFEEAMNALPINGISPPVVSRFGVHLIQVVERRSATLDTKQQREQARNVLRELKFDEAYAEWIRDLRARAYVEMREAPQ
jgi:peptidyl-prolyl cis-trans isomerase SurA